MSTSGAERRKSRRRTILSTFAVSVVVPKKGPHRLELLDASEAGVGFNLDIEDEAHESFPIAHGDRIELELYLNQSLKLALEGRVVRIEGKGGVRKVGCEIQMAGKPPAYRAYLAFLALVDALADAPTVTTT